MNWENILMAELGFTALALLFLGFIKLPRFFYARKLARGSPWGYYSDALPQTSYLQDGTDTKDFLHDTGTEFGGPEGFGDYGEFTGFGELGEFGTSFYGGHE